MSEQPQGAEGGRGRRRSGADRVPRRAGLVHRFRPGSIALVGGNALMLLWLVVRGVADFGDHTEQCDAMTGTRMACPPPSHAGSVLVVLVWVFADIVGGAIWVATFDRAMSIRSRRYGPPS